MIAHEQCSSSIWLNNENNSTWLCLLLLLYFGFFYYFSIIFNICLRYCFLILKNSGMVFQATEIVMFDVANYSPNNFALLYY